MDLKEIKPGLDSPDTGKESVAEMGDKITGVLSGIKWTNILSILLINSCKHDNEHPSSTKGGRFLD